MSYNFGLPDGLMVFAVLAAIAATVLAFIFLVPEKRRAKLNGFGKFIHDTLNFKYLIISKVLQAFFAERNPPAAAGGFYFSGRLPKNCVSNASRWRRRCTSGRANSLSSIIRSSSRRSTQRASQVSPG